VTSLSAAQCDLLAEWLGAWELIADYSWPLQDTTVLRVKSADGDFIVKASETSHHPLREILAHERIGGLGDLVPQLVRSSSENRMLVTRYLPGVLVEGTAAEFDPETYRQAGALLSRLLVPAGRSGTYLPELISTTLDLVPRAVGLARAAQLEAVSAELRRVRPFEVELSFTHGDFQPRNWLLDDGVVRLIDFGRAATRHWTSDLVRLQHKHFVGHPELASAFHSGLDRELHPEDEAMRRLESLNQALGTIVWAHDIGDADFEEHGRVMLTRLLDG
jgi:hypothetical protein